MTVRGALDVAAQFITRRDAETLLTAILGRDRAWLLAHPEDLLSDADEGALAKQVQRRGARAPLQHLTGTQEFYGLRLRVTPDTLIPRPETEHLVQAVLEWYAAKGEPATPLRIIDVGTGTGAIALALTAHLPAAEISAADISERALLVARENAAALGLSDRIRFISSDLLAAFHDEPPFDVIVSNPPYIPSGDAATMQPEVVAYEPHLALFAGADGLDIYRLLIPQAWAALREGGLLAMEFGYGQREALQQLLQSPGDGWRQVRFLDDYAGIPRVVLAERAG